MSGTDIIFIPGTGHVTNSYNTHIIDLIGDASSSTIDFDSSNLIVQIENIILNKKIN